MQLDAGLFVTSCNDGQYFETVLQLAHSPHVRPLQPLGPFLCQLLTGPRSGQPRLGARSAVGAVVGEVVAVGQFAVGQGANPVGVGGQHHHAVERGGGLVAPPEAFVEPAGHHAVLEMGVQHQATRSARTPDIKVFLASSA